MAETERSNGQTKLTSKPDVHTSPPDPFDHEPATMGGKTELYKRSSLVFFFLGVVALGLQLAGVILPFWVEDVWFPVAQQSFANKNKALFRVFQGLWSDYKCREGYRETSSAPEDHMQLTEGGELRYRDCSIRMQSLHHQGPEGRLLL